MLRCTARVQLPSEYRISHSSQSTYFDAVALVCDAGYVGYDLFGRLLKQQCSFLIRLSPHELPRLARSVGRPRGGCFWLEPWTTPTIPPGPRYREPMPEDLVSQRYA